MKGMYLMLKSMGFDPDAIKVKVEETQTKAVEVLKHFNSRFDSIDSRLESIENRMKENEYANDRRGA